MRIENMSDLHRVEIKQLVLEDVLRYKEEISGFIYESVKMSNYEESYTMDLANKKTNELCDYIQNNEAIVLGAFAKDKIIGFLWAYKYPFREDTNRLYISIVHVLTEFRNLHIGTGLIGCIEKIARENGFDRMYLHAEACNSKACRFYERNGFFNERIQYFKEIN